MNWKEQKEADKRVKELNRLARIMESAVPRGEVIDRHNALAQNVATIALAVEAFELILVEKGILEPDQLMKKLEALVKEKKDSLEKEKEEHNSPVITGV